jgi:Acetyltransferase (GNAT) domain
VRGRIIQVSRELAERDRYAWSALAARAVEPNPFLEPECVIAAARNLPSGDGIRLAIVEDDDAFLACLPLQHVSTGWQRMPGASYRTATTRVRRVNYLGTPLVDGSRGPEAMVRLLATVAGECRAAGSYAVELWDVAAGGPVDGYLHEAADRLGLPLRVAYSFERGILRRDETTVEGRPPPSVGDLDAKRRELGRLLDGELTLVDRGDEAAISDYIRLESSGYRAETGVAMAAVAGEPAYFTEMCQAFACEGRLHLLSLEAGSTTVATVGWIRAGDSIFQFKWSYDAAFAQCAPGVQIHRAAIEHFRADMTSVLLDTCTGEHNDIVSEMYPGRRTLNLYRLVVSDGWRQRGQVALVDGVRGVRGRIARRMHPPRTPLGAKPS